MATIVCVETSLGWNEGDVWSDGAPETWNLAAIGGIYIVFGDE